MSSKFNTTILHDIGTKAYDLKISKEINKRFGKNHNIDIVDTKTFLKDNIKIENVDLLILYLNGEFCDEPILSFLNDIINNQEGYKPTICPIIIDSLAQLNKRDLDFILSDIHTYPNSERALSQFSGYGLDSVISEIILFIEGKYTAYLNEEADFNAIQSSNNDYKIERCSDYLSKKTFAKHRKEVEDIYRRLLIELSDSGLWQRTVSLNTIDGYEFYIKTSAPEKKYIDEAKRNIESLKSEIKQIALGRDANNLDNLNKTGSRILEIDAAHQSIKSIKKEIESILISNYNDAKKDNIDSLVAFQSSFDGVNVNLITYNAKRYYNLSKRIVDRLIHLKNINDYKALSELKISAIEQGDTVMLTQYISSNPNTPYIEDIQNCIYRIEVAKSPIKARWRKFKYKKNLIISLSLFVAVILLYLFLLSIQLSLSNLKMDTVYVLPVDNIIDTSDTPKSMKEVICEPNIAYNNHVLSLIEKLKEDEISEDDFFDSITPFINIDPEVAYICGYRHSIQGEDKDAQKLYSLAYNMGSIRSLRSVCAENNNYLQDSILHCAIEYCRRDSILYDGIALKMLIDKGSNDNMHDIELAVGRYYEFYKNKVSIPNKVQQIFCDYFTKILSSDSLAIDNSIKYINKIRPAIQYWCMAALYMVGKDNIVSDLELSQEFYAKAIVATENTKIKGYCLLNHAIFSSGIQRGTDRLNFKTNINKFDNISIEQLYHLIEACELGNRESANLLGLYYASLNRIDAEKAIKYFEFAMTSDDENAASEWARYNLGSLYYYGRLNSRFSRFPHDKRKGEELLKQCTGKAKAPAELILSNDLWWNKYDVWLW